ncbi:unnamed protein product, partial [Hymenolepis diminuta]
MQAVNIKAFEEKFTDRMQRHDTYSEWHMVKIDKITKYGIKSRNFMNRELACSRLLNDGSFLVANDEDEPAKFFIFVKWSGQCHEIEIKYNTVTEKYGLGSIEFSNVADLISYYKDNQLPVGDKLGAILFVPVSLPQNSNIK